MTRLIRCDTDNGDLDPIRCRTELTDNRDGRIDITATALHHGWRVVPTGNSTYLHLCPEHARHDLTDDQLRTHLERPDWNSNR